MSVLDDYLKSIAQSDTSQAKIAELKAWAAKYDPDLYGFSFKVDAGYRFAIQDVLKIINREETK